MIAAPLFYAMALDKPFIPIFKVDSRDLSLSIDST